MILKTFVLIGVIDSFDSHFATVELNMNQPPMAHQRKLSCL
jgi:hypothetical protein